MVIKDKDYSKYKNITNKQFRDNPFLVNKYGLFNDTDRDSKINIEDCYPFDKKRQDSYALDILTGKAAPPVATTTYAQDILSGKAAPPVATTTTTSNLALDILTGKAAPPVATTTYAQDILSGKAAPPAPTTTAGITSSAYPGMTFSSMAEYETYNAQQSAIKLAQHNAAVAQAMAKATVTMVSQPGQPQYEMQSGKFIQYMDKSYVPKKGQPGYVAPPVVTVTPAPTPPPTLALDILTGKTPPPEPVVTPSYVTPTPSIFITPITPTPVVTPAPTPKPEEWSGKFEEISPTGEVLSTQYVVKGVDVGKVVVTPEGSFLEPAPQVKEASLLFTTPTTSKEVIISPFGLTTTVSTIQAPEPPKQPTQAEALATGGGIFLKSSENILGVTTDIGEKGYGQKTIEYAESLMGMETGTSGVVFIPAQTKVINPLTGGYTITDIKGVKQEYTALGQPLLSGEVSSLADWTGTGIRPAISTQLEKLGTTGKVIDIFVPKTATGTVLAAGGLLTYGFLPAVAKVGVSGYLGTTGTIIALDKDLPTEQRIAGGIVGGLGLLGLGLEVKGAFFPKIKPVEQTSFIATIERGKGDISTVNVLSKTGKITSIATEKIINIPKTDSFLGGGKGFRAEVIPKKTGDVVKISEFQTIGGGKEVGMATLVKDLGVIKQLKEAGTGIISKSFFRDTGKGLEKAKVLNPLTGKVEIIKKAVIEKPSGFVKQDILGVVKKIEGEEGLSAFFGTAKPIVRVYKKGGVSYIIRKPEIKGIISVVGEEPQPLSVTEAGIGAKTPFSKTFPQLTGLEQKAVLSLVSIPKTITTIKPVKLNLGVGVAGVVQKIEVPRMVGGTGRVVLDYSSAIGKRAIIEEFNIGRLPTTVEIPKVKEISGTGITSIFRLLPTTEESSFLPSVVKTQQFDLIKDVEKGMQLFKEEIKVAQKEEQRFFQPIKETQKEILKVNQVEKFLQLQTTKQRLLQQERIARVPRQVTKQIIPIIVPPRVTPRVTIKILPSKGGVAKEISEEDFLFEVYGRRFGKDVKLYETKEKQKSKEELVKFLKTTLGRSGYVEKEGRKLSFEELGLNREFTPSKTRKDVIVQRAKYALSSFGEKREIRGAKKKISFFR